MQVVCACEFGGGLETLFGGKRRLEVEMSQGDTIRQLIQHLSDEYVKERRELFQKSDAV